MAILLQLETSSTYCSVSLSNNGTVLNEQQSTQAMDHLAKITLLIEGCLAEAGINKSQLDGVAVSQGPGSYTGLRVGVSAAKGICYGLDIPLIGINTLEALAVEGWRLYPDADIIIPMIDARRMEVYASIYGKNDTIRENFNIIVDKMAFNAYFDKNNKVIAIGNGALKTEDVIDYTHYTAHYLANTASLLIPLSHKKFDKQQFEDLVQFAPDYIKAPNITVPKSKFL